MKEVTALECENLMQDISYLQEEMYALKQVISAIPFAERPLEQESVYDMLARIAHAQKVFGLPVLKYALQIDGYQTLIDLEFDKSFKPVNIEETSVEQLIELIAVDREMLVSLLSTSPLSIFFKKLSGKGFENKKLFELLEEMVIYERNQLKQIAERVISIDVENRFNPDNKRKEVL